MSIATGNDAIVVNQGLGGTTHVNVGVMTDVQASFDTALNALATEGGKITVLPGTQAYQFLDTAGDGFGIEIDGASGRLTSNIKDNVEIELMPGAILEANTSSITELIRCTGANFRLTGGGKLLRDTAADVTSGYLLRLEGSAEQEISGTYIDNIEFESAGNDPTNKAVSIEGSSATDLSHGCWVQNCRFRGIDAGDNITWLEISNILGVTVKNNLFYPATSRSAAPELDPTSGGEYGIRLINTPRFAVCNNSFHDCDSSEAQISVEVASNEEGGHGQVSGNTMEGSAGTPTHLIRVACDFVQVIGNNLDRHSDLSAGVCVTYKADGVTLPRGVCVKNNQFHSYSASVGGTTRYGIHLDAVDGCLVTGNQFFNLHQSGVFLRVDKECLRVKFPRNSNLINGDQESPEHAVVYWRLEAGDAYASIIANENEGTQPFTNIRHEQAWPDLT